MKMASYREVATKDVQKRLRRLLEAETKPLIMDLLRIKRGGFIQNFKMRGPGSVKLGESKLNFCTPLMRLVRKFLKAFLGLLGRKSVKD